MAIPNHHINERLFFLEENAAKETDFDTNEKYFI